MLSVLRSVSSQQQQSNDSSPAKFWTVLGLNISQRGPADAHSPSPLATEDSLRSSFTRRSADAVARPIQRKHHRGSSSPVIDTSPVSQAQGCPAQPDPSFTLPEMKNSMATQSMPTRRIPFRVDNQDGPWTVSVAETPHDHCSYSIYVKTPTHNITLTRTAVEIVELHGKLRDSHPGFKMPLLPIDAASIPAPPKRKSVFLNTLSRLASPSAKASGQRQLSRQPSMTSTSTGNAASIASASSSALPTPLASPKNEISDPFSDNDDEDDVQAPLTTANSTVTGLAAYLTTVANDSLLRQARVWKRFVKVRTDDLHSVRVERAIKRVRSDLAAHVSPGSSTDINRSISQVVLNGDEENTQDSSALSAPSTNGVQTADGPQATQSDGPAPEDIKAEDVKDGEMAARVVPADLPVQNGASEHAEGPGENETDGIAEDSTDEATVEGQDGATTPRSSRPSSPHVQDAFPAPAPIETKAVVRQPIDDEDANAPATPMPSDGHSHRIPRSQSADPMSRASRTFFSSPLQSQANSSRTSQIEESTDDSSISTTGRRSERKKRSKSMDPHSEKKKSQRKVAINDFEMMRVLGKGCAGKVLLVRHKPTQDVFALKAITKRHVLAHQELQHTLTEQAVLKRMAAEGTDPFVVKLWWSFHDKENLFLVMDFHPGGDLATQLARWGRLGRDRARFYAAEIVEGVEGLHAAGVIYRDLKPENILIGADGHIVLTDFGLSKEFPRRTTAITAPPTPSGFRGDFANGTPAPAAPHWMKASQEFGTAWAPTGPADCTSTFCGTAEYLAPEVIQGQAYSFEVDWWSFGTMLYEMLTGITPFWADNHSDMYYRVLQDELQFPEDRTMDQDTKSLIRGLLQRNPALRMKEPRIKKHPYFSMIDWSHVYYKRYIPPYIPPIDPSNASDTQNFDETFLDMEPVINDDNDNEQTDTDQEGNTDTERTDGEDSLATPSLSRSPSVHPEEEEEDSVDAFDGYSYKGRHSIILDDDEEEDADADEEDEEDEEEDEETSTSAASIDNILLEEEVSKTVANSVEELREDAIVVEEGPEHKTPEARRAELPKPAEPVASEAPASPVAEQRVAEKVAEKVEVAQPTEKAATEPIAVAAETVAVPLELGPTPEEIKPVKTQESKTVKTKVQQPRVTAARRNGRREKSGIPALDRDLSDAHDEDEPSADHDEDDEWDFVEAEVVEERNGAKGTSLFARGVVDRYKLAVFRKSTPRWNGGPRVFAGIAADSDLISSNAADSPSPAEKRRGRAPGLTFRKHPKQFLRQKSPQAASRTTVPSNPFSPTASATLSPSSSGLLSPSTNGGSTLPPPSLRSKESAVSMGSPSESEQSVNGDARAAGDGTIRGSAAVGSEDDKQKNKVLKKYKEGAEKVLSIFQSPR